MRRLLCIGFLLLSGFTVHSQDIHLTQFYTNPMFVNSANAGNFNGDYRVGINAKSQWASVSDPYTTVALHSDFGIVPSGSNSDNWIGMGATFFVDSEGGGVLQTINAHAHLAFHKHLRDNAYLSLGAGFGYINKSVDLNMITFGAQWDGSEFNGTIPSMENFQNDNIGYFDMSAGAAFTYSVKNTFRFTAGFSAHHINEPTESFFFQSNDSGNNRRQIRPTAHVDAEIMLDAVSVMPAAYFTTTKDATEVILGSNISYDLDGTAVIGGLWFHGSGSIALLGGLQLERNRVMLSYGLDLGGLKDISGGNNGLELSIARVGGMRKSKSKMYCPRF